MNKLYHKVAVASVCTAIGFALVASEEVKAATITLTPTIQFGVNVRYNHILDVTSGELSSQYNRVSREFDDPFSLLTAKVVEFNISSFLFAPNTVIKSAVFQDRISRFGEASPVGPSIGGYGGNGTAEASDAWEHVDLLRSDFSASSPGDTINFDVTEFVNGAGPRNSNGFAGFVLLPWLLGELTLEGTDALGRSSLIIETADVAEPVPEPTTIFGYVIALGVGGWLKRKNSSRHNKIALQR
jgi:hypothetical protein